MGLGLGWFIELWNGMRRAAIDGAGFTTAGPNGSVTEMEAEAAQTVAAVYAAVRAYSDALSSVDFIPYSLKTGEPATEHYLYPLLKFRWNAEQTSQQAMEFAIRSYWLAGNSYNQVVKSAAGRVREIVPLSPKHVEPRRINGKIVYQLTDRTAEPFTYDQVAHIYQNYRKETLRGQSPIGYARSTIAQAKSQDNYALKFFTQGVGGRLFLKTAKTLSADKKKQILDDFNNMITGEENASRTGLLEGDLSIEKIAISPEESQFLETRRFGVSEVARWFNLPNSRLGGDRTSGIYANIQQDQAAFVVHSLRPVCRAFASVFNNLLLTEEERTEVELRFDLEDLVDDLAYLNGNAAGPMTAPAPTEVQNEVV